MFSELSSGGENHRIVDLAVAAGADLERLPVIQRILLENVLRTGADDADRGRHSILDWLKTGTSEAEIPFLPGRILMHDTTCGPALVDIAAMRSALAEAGCDPRRLSPIVPVDVSTDHSVAVDVFGTPDARRLNMEREFERNGERYRFMKWAANVLPGFRVHPPGTGIMHTLNLERLATIVDVTVQHGIRWARPDSLIGTDSHTPMVNGIGVLAWGVGGLEAESVMFGLPVMLRVPEVIGVKLIGCARAGVLATDIALHVTERLRRLDLGDRFVEFFGPGVSTLTAGNRAVIANMAPEFGANSGFFPIDTHTLRYMSETGRNNSHIRLVQDYAKRQGLWFDPAASPKFTELVEIDLGMIAVSLAGPHRPQDRIDAGETAASLGLPAIHADEQPASGPPRHGSLAIAAITSCTNTTDPRLLIAAGLVARKARAFGLKPKSWVKTSLAPGSPVAERYLQRAGLLEDLEALGFGIVGYGCTTCIGNSGPLTSEMLAAMAANAINPVAVLSGNRNFPGRVHTQLDAAFLASPPMVVAFALAGDVNRNIMIDDIGQSTAGPHVTLADIWPTDAEIDSVFAQTLDTSDYALAYDQAEASDVWRSLAAPEGDLYDWDDTSTYIRRPPFAVSSAGPSSRSCSARPLIVLGDDITTDHISPAGQIPWDSDAAGYLVKCGAKPSDLNVFSSRRGNWEVMLRGLFTNNSIRNLLDPTLKPGFTILAGSGEQLPIWRAAERYAREGTPVVIIAGERYGMGSSRDWAAKGAALLGVTAVLARSFERIHRSNLIGMGILPLRIISADRHPNRLDVKPDDLIEIDAPAASLSPRCHIPVAIRRSSGAIDRIETIAAIETNLEVELLRVGGVIPSVLHRALKSDRDAVSPPQTIGKNDHAR